MSELRLVASKNIIHTSGVECGLAKVAPFARSTRCGTNLNRARAPSRKVRKDIGCTISFRLGSFKKVYEYKPSSHNSEGGQVVRR